jgi:phosphoribosylanthranilate isomerase
MKFKVCGMNISENILDVAELKPNYMGFIFWKKSLRYLKTEIPNIDSEIKKTGVFVDESIHVIKDKIKIYNLKAIQLHGNETPSDCEKIKALGVECIKTFNVKDDFNFNELKSFKDTCDYFLFDSKGKLPGGNGFGFNWEILEGYSMNKPFFLSGGIGIQDIPKIKTILKSTLPIYAIDVNSKFEFSPGKKNIELLNKFKLNVFK